MSGIVIELQSDALNQSINTIALLRKAYLISRKLKLIDFVEWVDCELNGYRTKKNIPIPEYRTVWGQLKAWNPYNGWMPVIFEDSETQDSFSKRNLWDSIPSLDTAIRSGKGLNMAVPSEMVSYLNKQSRFSEIGFETNFSLFFSTNSIQAIIETVRNHILEWAILLEENNIIGNGLEFSANEKQQAKHPIIIQYTSNFYGNVDNSQFQQGTTSSQQLKST